MLYLSAHCFHTQANLTSYLYLKCSTSDHVLCCLLVVILTDYLWMGRLRLCFIIYGSTEWIKNRLKRKMPKVVQKCIKTFSLDTRPIPIKTRNFHLIHSVFRTPSTSQMCLVIDIYRTISITYANISQHTVFIFFTWISMTLWVFAGDVEHTHLVKGLHYALLNKVRSEIVKKPEDEDATDGTPR